MWTNTLRYLYIYTATVKSAVVNFIFRHYNGRHLAPRYDRANLSTLDIFSYNYIRLIVEQYNVSHFGMLSTIPLFSFWKLAEGHIKQSAKPCQLH